MNKILKNAFTATELLIVLMVIGFLAVFTINNLSGASPDRNKMLFKKAYSVTEKTVQELVNDETLYPYNPNKLGLINNIGVQIPGQEEGQLTSTDDNTKFVTLFKDKLNILSDEGTETIDSKKYAKFSTTDGILWYVQIVTPQRGTTSDKGIEIIVDVDGKDKGPNAFASDPAMKDDPSADKFKFYVLFDGKMLVEGEMEKKFLTSHSLKRDQE